MAVVLILSMLIIIKSIFLFCFCFYVFAMQWVLIYLTQLRQCSSVKALPYADSSRCFCLNMLWSIWHKGKRKKKGVDWDSWQVFLIALCSLPGLAKILCKIKDIAKYLLIHFYWLHLKALTTSRETGSATVISEPLMCVDGSEKWKKSWPHETQPMIWLL